MFFAISKENGQAALEQLILTGFILAGVIIVFAIAYVNYDQSIKTAQANDAITTMASAADKVYLLGEGNAQFVDVSFPPGLEGLEVLNVCNDGITVEAGECSDPSEGGINYSIIKITMGLIAGSSEITRASRAKIVLENFPAASQTAPWMPYPVRVSWVAGKVELRMVV